MAKIRKKIRQNRSISLNQFQLKKLTDLCFQGSIVVIAAYVGKILTGENNDNALNHWFEITVVSTLIIVLILVGLYVGSKVKK